MNKTAKRCRIVRGRKETCCINPKRGFNLDFETDNSGTMTSFVFEDYEAVNIPDKTCESEP